MRQCAVHDPFHLLHRLLMNGGDLRFRRVENRLNLCLLIRGQIQLLGRWRRPNACPCSPPWPPRPGCACTATKPPSAIARAATNANMLLFIVCFILFSRNVFSLLQVMTDRHSGWLQFSCTRSLQRRLLATGAWHKRVYSQDCNQSAPVAVIATSVDALSITWMILTQVRLFVLRSSMMMRRLARWCESFIRSSPKSSALIARIERMKRIFAK